MTLLFTLNKVIILTEYIKSSIDLSKAKYKENVIFFTITLLT